MKIKEENTQECLKFLPNIRVELLWRGAVETPFTGVAPHFSGNF